MEVTDILKLLTREHIIKIMEDEYGATYKSYDNGVIAFESICHNSTSKKLYYYHEPRNEGDIGRVFYCFVCNTSGNIIDILEQLSGYTFKEALKIVGDVVGVDTTYRKRIRGIQRKPQENTDLKFLSIHNRKKRQPKRVEKVYDDTILDNFNLEYPQCWQEEGIDSVTADVFDIRYNPNTNQAVIPVRDIQGQLIGVRVRNFDESTVEKGYKYMPLMYRGITYTFPTSNTLYGIWENQDIIRETGKVILFESEKSVLMLDTFYDSYCFGLAVYGSNLSLAHRDMLLALKVKEITICFDKEYCAEWFDSEYDKTKEQTLMFSYFKKLKKIAKMLSSYFTVNIVIDFDNNLDLKDSPVDKGKEVFELLLKDKITIVDVDNDFYEIFGI